jgi:hypothetical protein
MDGENIKVALTPSKVNFVSEFHSLLRALHILKMGQEMRAQNSQQKILHGEMAEVETDEGIKKPGTMDEIKTRNGEISPTIRWPNPVLYTSEVRKEEGASLVVPLPPRAFLTSSKQSSQAFA